ncbi:MAG: hypothetical protein WBD67_09080 [Terracidiphilus sp.]
MTRLLHARISAAPATFASLAVLTALPILVSPGVVATQPSPAATAAYDTSIRSLESRLAQQHLSQREFLASLAPGSSRDRELRRGALLLEDLTPAAPNLPGAMLHHWRATTFVPGATATGFDRLLRDFSAYPHIFAPQVERIAILSGSGDRYQIEMRLRQHHMLTVILELTCTVSFRRLDARRGSSVSACIVRSQSSQSGESSADQGFLWRMNTYWSYEQRNGGLYLQLESVSLSRSIPFGLAWAVRPYVESIPRDSLAFTLSAARRTLQQSPRRGALPPSSVSLNERN